MADIIVADDEAGIRFVVQAHLEHLGHRVRCAADGHAARKLVDAQRPDLVILDVMMPHDGITTAEALRADPRTADLRLLALTAVGDETRRATNAFDGYLGKPFRADELKRSVEALLGDSLLAESDAAA